MEQGTLLRAGSNRHGSVLLILLVVIAIGMVLYFLDMRAIFGPSMDGRDSAPQSRPWLEEDLIKEPGEEIKRPKSPKPQIDVARELTAGVSREGAQRGTMKLAFAGAGRVNGTWQCEYQHGDQDYAYDANFAGNIAADKVFVSEDGKKDKSLLYFITKGKYSQRLTTTNTNQTTAEQGTIYVTGWLSPDDSARGLITITTDNKWSVTYDWQSNR